MLNLKLQYFGHLMCRIDSFEKTLMLGKTGRWEEEMTEDEMIGWHHNLIHMSLSKLKFIFFQYVTTGKNIALTRWTFVGKVMSLLFNTLSRLVIAFLPRSKHLLISWLQSPSEVIFSSVAQLCPTLCDPMNRSMPGLLVHHQLPEFTQTHVQGVNNAIQPSHPLPPP